MTMWPPERITRVRLQLMLGHPYMASAVARLPLVDASDMPWCSTMATDGYYIYIHPEFCDGLDDQELSAVLAHELMHCVLGHTDRRGSRNRRIWNIAIDHATNLLLQDAGFKLPTSGLADRQFHGMTAEAIYKQLVGSTIENQRKQGSKKGDNFSDAIEDDKSGLQESNSRLLAEGGFDCHVDPDDEEGASIRRQDFPTELERRRIRMELGRRLVDSFPGREAGYYVEEIARATQPQVDWRHVLAQFITGLRRNDFRLYPFNRKHLWRGLYLPSIGVPGPNHLVIAVDTSSSMTSDILIQVLAEVDALRGASECQLTLIQCDTKIQQVRTYEPWNTSSQDFREMKFLGRGGTDLRPPFDWIRENLERNATPPDALIYLTDGFGPPPEKAPSYPTVWIMPAHSANSLPFGQIIQFESFQEAA